MIQFSLLVHVFKFLMRDKQLEERKVQYINLLADGNISQEEYKLMIVTNNDQFKSLIIEKEEISLSIDTEGMSSIINKLKMELSKSLNFEELTEEMLHRLINRIDIKQDGTPVIHYRSSVPTID